jgi:sugar lactone lactonase YvrE
MADNRWEPSAPPIRYPDPNIQILDKRFEKYLLPMAAIERIAGGCRFTEGPVWFGDGRYLLWSDIPNDRILRWEEETAAISVFRRPSEYANGNTRDRLYVVDTPGGDKTTYVYDVVEDGTKLANGRLFFNTMPGYADGIRVDTDGNVWCGFSGGEGEDGLAVFAPDGTLIGRILLPERCANVCFGGKKRNRLFMAASQSVYALYVEAQGVLGG